MNNQRLSEQISIECGMNEIMTRQGIIRGLKSEGIYLFRGIEYAKAERFLDPVPVEPWEGVKEALTYGNACPELNTPVYDNFSRNHPYYTVQSEDCLYLNVFTKEYNRNDLRPVRVFFMDRDFSSGFGVEKLLHDAIEEVKISDTLIVTVNTRLNVLGYLDLSDYGSKYKHSGCLGLVDRAAALDWIKENIEYFGGNPDLIKVYTSEAADSDAFIERTKEEAKKMTDYFFEALKVKKDERQYYVDNILGTLLYNELADAALEAEELASNEFNRKLIFSPVIDSEYCKGHPIAVTPNGLLRGEKKDSSYIFRGIKYADAKRFRMPSAVKPWSGIKNALTYGAVCPEIQTVQPDDNFTVPHVFYPQHEDCQYLNIWTQSLNPESKAPVMVWFHGGGFATGSGIEHFAYNGKDLSESGNVVVVTLNHRLNVLGYLDLSEYGDEYKYSGNVGNADLVEALRWIKHNISSFGGDPNNVTIFGQSGGGGKVAALLQTPSANGLFHRAIIQSGLANFGRKENKMDLTALLLDKLGISKDNISELDTIPYYKLADALLSIDKRAPFLFGPHQDDDFYLGDALSVGICSHAKTVPVMVGNVLGEFCQNFVATVDDGRKNDWDYEKTLSIVSDVLKDNAETAIRLQKEAYPEKPLANLLFTDRMFRPSTFDYLKLRAEDNNNNTFGYMFLAEMPVYGGILPWHNAEIPYVFHNAHCIEPSYIEGVTDKLEDEMSQAFVNFAKYGTPGFLPYTKSDHSMMYFDKESYLRNSDSEEKLVRFLQSVSIKLTPVVRQKEPIFFAGGPRIN